MPSKYCWVEGAAKVKNFALCLAAGLPHHCTLDGFTWPQHNHTSYSSPLGLFWWLYLAFTPHLDKFILSNNKRARGRIQNSSGFLGGDRGQRGEELVVPGPRKLTKPLLSFLSSTSWGKEKTLYFHYVLHLASFTQWQFLSCLLSHSAMQQGRIKLWCTISSIICSLQIWRK